MPVLGDGSVLAGTYGGGLVMVQAGVSSYNLDAPEREKEPGFPAEARMEESAKVLKSLEDLGRRGDKGKSIVFKGEDWSTKGDWGGKYGMTRATLCATNAPMSNS